MATFKLRQDNHRFILDACSTPPVMVSYDRQFNMVEVYEGKQVITCNIVPDKFTLNAFLDYAHKVKDVYTRQS